MTNEDRIASLTAQVEKLAVELIGLKEGQNGVAECASSAAFRNTWSAAASRPSADSAVARRSVASRLYGSAARICSSNGIASGIAGREQPRGGVDRLEQRRHVGRPRGVGRTTGAAPALT